MHLSNLISNIQIMYVIQIKPLGGSYFDQEFMKLNILLGKLFHISNITENVLTR